MAGVAAKVGVGVDKGERAVISSGGRGVEVKCSVNASIGVREV